MSKEKKIKEVDEELELCLKLRKLRTDRLRGILMRSF